MSWLLRDDDVLAVVEDRRKGWRDDLRGAVLLAPPALLHTFACRQSLDAAWCTAVATDDGGRAYRVRTVTTLAPNRCGRPHLAPGILVVAAAGAFERWNLRPGDQLEVRAA